MPRKPSIRSRSIPSPVPAALERLAKLSGAGMSADRMAREAEKTIAGWRAEEIDAGELAERLETLREDLAAGVASAEEQAGDVDASDKAATRQAAVTVTGLRAALRVAMGAP